MSAWKDLLSKLAEGVKNEPLLAFGGLMVIVLALLGAQILPDYRPLIYVIVLVGLFVYAARLLGFGRKETPVSAPPPAPAPSVPVVAPSADARDQYLNAVIADCRSARLVGLDPAAADPSRGGLPLDKLYIELDTKTSVEEKFERGKKERDAEALARWRGESTRPLPALEALAQAPHRRMVLLGLPGTGKSTFIRYLALQLARALRDPSLDSSSLLPGWQGQAVMPLIVPLGRLAESFPANAQKGQARLIEQFVHTLLESDARTRDFAPLALKTVRESGGVVLFDGLDEVADLNLRPVVTQAVEDFAEQYGRNAATRFLVTCRTYSYTDPRWQLTNWATHELALFTPEKINRFIQAWYDQHTLLDPAKRDDYNLKRSSMLKAVEPGERRRLSEVADNPLILTVMAVVNTHEGTLPDTRAQVYAKCIEQLLFRWELQRTILGQTKKRDLLSALELQNSGLLYDALAEVAYEAHKGRGDHASSALVTEDLLKGKLSIYLRDDAKVKTFLEYCEGANGLLMWQGEIALPDAPPDAPRRRVYTFPHPTFEEYLAAQFLKGPNLGARVRDHLDQKFDRWREVVMFLGEHLCFASGDYERMDAIFAVLAPDAPPQTLADWRALWMAGDLLSLYRRRFSKASPSDARVMKELVALIETGRLTPRERVATGDTLARLGDPRPGVGISPLLSKTGEGLGVGVPDLVWCEIPPGSFTMGSKDDPEAYDDEKPQITYNIPYSYYIARYPITNAQFDAFVRDPDGYRNPQWWTDAGKRWCGEQTEPHKAGGVFDLPNHPIVNIRFYEAVAFARWLDARLKGSSEKLKVWRGDHSEPIQLPISNFQLRLPTEAEWEKAARGPSTPSSSPLSLRSESAQEARRYPWGNAPDPNRANYDQTGIGATSAVGCFPDGHSPYNVLDMSGNVWEWCATRWVDNYRNYGENENNDLEGNALRVVRGGAFYNASRDVRCAVRDRGYPDYWGRLLGFRVVLSPVRL